MKCHYDNWCCALITKPISSIMNNKDDGTNAQKFLSNFRAMVLRNRNNLFLQVSEVLTSNQNWQVKHIRSNLSIFPHKMPAESDKF